MFSVAVRWPGHQDKRCPLPESSAHRPLNRLAIIDLLRGLAAVFVAWHHLSLYAPQSDLADRVWPLFGFFLYNQALYAVAIFFVIAGLTTSLSRSTPPHSWSEFLQTAIARYLRLAIPYLAMLAGLLCVNAIAVSQGYELHLIDRFSWSQVISHIFFLQDLLGYGNLSAGTWYLCIDMQWLILTLLIGFGLQKTTQNTKQHQILTCLTICLLGISSAWWFSHRPEYEPTVLYFVSQLALGWLLGMYLQEKIPKQVLLLYTLTVSCSLFVYPRPQLLVSLCAAFIIWIDAKTFRPWKLPAPVQWLSNISYSLFLVHYLVHSVVLAMLNPWASQSPGQALVAMAIAFIAALTVAHFFYEWVDKPVQRWLKSRRF